MTHPSTLTRREALRRAGMGLGAIASAPPFGPAAPRAPSSPARAKRIAAVVTEYRMDSHAEVIVGKVLEGYSHDGGEGPSLKLVSLYVDQFPANDLSRGLARKHGFKIYDTIEGALTLGGGELAVEGVLCIGEHGRYPTNKKGQILYPRRRFFGEVAQAFTRYRKSVPVFSDKHLAAAWEDARWMYDKARELRVPLLAGSSLPVTYRRPPLELPRQCELVEAAQVYHGSLEGAGFHALEALQCMAERRKGFETGVKAVRALRGQAMWEEFDRGGWSRPLFEAALGRVVNHENGDYRRLSARHRDACLFFLEYRDGFRAVVGMLNGWARGDPDPAAFAGRLKGQEKPATTLFYLQEHFPYAHFAFQVKAIDSLIQTGEAPYPVERTLLTTGALDALMTSLAERGRPVETPHLAIRYTPTDWPMGRGPEPKPILRRRP